MSELITAASLSGKAAPDFRLADASGASRGLSDFAGTWLVLYFYPKASTPGCTREARDFTCMLPDFAAAGAAVVGVSPDSPKAIGNFTLKQDLDVALLSDPDRAVAKAYGAFGTKMMYGKAVTGIVRSTFLIGPDGTVRAVWSPVKVDGHAQAVRDELRRLAGK
ncbi:peroxiredoxin [Nitratidesulfovibrio sp. SRB-5]|uniref:peroxiredoxin n=1 Tax=Nitratidesulfovibrio sp. SRB-5 TaxID=2872636 RepID=UPI00102512EA|nr:peroxiredoxin [Nitratidesulfovibrio sp. SRB-5]MBZ2171034.1 peroxiredoxin [Nitratidesulfovibrio sp. SRB-5]RXF76293.1 peroxiredoxin [Desulfovibrio sp. DS-1]